MHYHFRNNLCINKEKAQVCAGENCVLGLIDNEGHRIDDHCGQLQQQKLAMCPRSS